jgi:hypothetical protein
MSTRRHPMPVVDESPELEPQELKSPLGFALVAFVLPLGLILAVALLR